MKICETAARLRRDPLFEVHCGIKGKEPRSQHKEYQMGLLAFDFALAFADRTLFLWNELYRMKTWHVGADDGLKSNTRFCVSGTKWTEIALSCVRFRGAGDPVRKRPPLLHGLENVDRRGDRPYIYALHVPVVNPSWSPDMGFGSTFELKASSDICLALSEETPC
eukprot:2649694-Rhodomonas_salina.1